MHKALPLQYGGKGIQLIVQLIREHTCTVLLLVFSVTGCDIGSIAAGMGVVAHVTPHSSPRSTV